MTEDARIWKASDLQAADIADPDFYLASQAISRQTISMIVGRRGTGKTMVTLSLGQKIALGEQFGPLVTKAGRVLFVSQEMSEASIHRRLVTLFGKAELEQVDDRFQIACQVPDIKMDSREGAISLKALVKDCQADVVMIDALRDIKGTADENSNNDAGELMVRLRDEVAVPTNSAIVLLHHAGKAGQDGEFRGGRGASAIEDTAADILYLVRKGDWRVLTFEKVREGDIEGQQVTIEFKHELGKNLELAISEGGPPEESHLDRKIREGTDFLKKNGGSYLRKAMVDAMGWSDRAMTDIVAKAAGNGLWESSGGGRGNPQVISLPKDG